MTSVSDPAGSSEADELCRLSDDVDDKPFFDDADGLRCWKDNVGYGDEQPCTRMKQLGVEEWRRRWLTWAMLAFAFVPLFLGAIVVGRFEMW